MTYKAEEHHEHDAPGDSCLDPGMIAGEKECVGHDRSHEEHHPQDVLDLHAAVQDAQAADAAELVHAQEVLQEGHLVPVLRLDLVAA